MSSRFGLPAAEVREMRAPDWPAVASIYAEGVATRNATFETEVPSWVSWDGTHLSAPRLVAAIDYKRENEVDPVRLRPHPAEFALYFDC